MANDNSPERMDFILMVVLNDVVFVVETEVPKIQGNNE